jgi:K+-transporting ATPase ATPase A chain
MDWKRYAVAFTLFGAVNVVIVYFLLRWQAWLPWFFPKVMTTPMTPDLAANTAVSFATTTTWQAYAGETTMSYFSQLVLAGQNFFAGAAGLAVGIAFIRGYARERTATLGNFWGDLIRAVLWVLLPMSILGSLMLIAQGVPMNFQPYTTAQTIEGATQTIAQGPVAALELIKNLGTNGGGFFNVNAAHPFENPTGLTNFLELLAIAVVPAALTHTFGRMVGRPRDGWVFFWTMTALFIAGLVACNFVESTTHPALARDIFGGNMEGKEQRFSIAGSALAAEVTSNTSTGSYNAMDDSFQPLGVALPLLNMLLGEIIYGGSRRRTLRNDLRRVDRALYRRLNDRPHARSSWETNWSAGDEDRRALYIGRAGHNAFTNSDCSGDKTRSRGFDHEHRRSWLHRNSFRLRKLLCQQRPNNGQPQCEQPLL